MEQKKNIFTLEMFGVKNEVKLEYASYGCNGTLALQLFCKPDAEEAGLYATDEVLKANPYQVPYGVVTVNLPESEMLKVNAQFVDENNLPGIGRWLEQNGIARPVDIVACSGYCTYRAYEFNATVQDLSRIISAREDAISLKLISRIEESGMAPSVRDNDGDTYHIAEGTDIFLYRGRTQMSHDDKPDVFLLESGPERKERARWRLRDLPSDVRESLARDISAALADARRSQVKIH